MPLLAIIILFMLGAPLRLWFIMHAFNINCEKFTITLTLNFPHDSVSLPVPALPPLQAHFVCLPATNLK